MSRTRWLGARQHWFGRLALWGGAVAVALPILAAVLLARAVSSLVCRQPTCRALAQRLRVALPAASAPIVPLERPNP